MTITSKEHYEIMDMFEMFMAMIWFIQLTHWPISLPN